MPGHGSITDERLARVALGATRASAHMVDGQVDQLVGHLFRHEAGRLVSVLTRVFGVGRLSLAEDVVQETLLTALSRWRFHGIPDDPTAWLFRVARNRALDVLRREAAWRRRGDEVGRWLEAAHADTPGGLDRPAEAAIEDDQLRMVFTACHPRLSPESRVALTLRTLCGLSVPEIARAFLTDERAVAQRLVRAKRTLRDARVEFEVPVGEELRGRLDTVLRVLYLLFNEGYEAHAGEALVRAELCTEAVRLGELLARQPQTTLPRVHALIALMLFQASRLPARVDGHGDLLLLGEQDRTRWDHTLIRRGFQHLAEAARGTELSTYHLEAGIAACHAAAPSEEATDWGAVLDAYDRLLALEPSPVAAVNRAVALAMVRGPVAAIAELERLRTVPALRGYHLLPAALGALYARVGDPSMAAACYREGWEKTASLPARRFLERKLRALDQPSSANAAPVADPTE